MWLNSPWFYTLWAQYGPQTPALTDLILRAVGL
jgi:hypothetical protein